jgi:hypothetical protein
MGSILRYAWTLQVQPLKEKKGDMLGYSGRTALRSEQCDMNLLRRWRTVGAYFHSDNCAVKCRQTLPAQQMGGGCSHYFISHSNGWVVFMRTDFSTRCPPLGTPSTYKAERILEGTVE